MEFWQVTTIRELPADSTDQTVVNSVAEDAQPRAARPNVDAASKVKEPGSKPGGRLSGRLCDAKLLKINGRGERI